jgi:FtsZ-binding cell division protein ZapB
LLKKLPPIPDIPESDQTDWVKSLPALLEQFAQRVQYHSEEIALLKDEINILKGEKNAPALLKERRRRRW